MTLRKWMFPTLLLLLCTSLAQANPPATGEQYEYITLEFRLTSSATFIFSTVIADMDKEASKAFRKELKELKDYPKIINEMGSRGWRLQHTYLAPTATDAAYVLYVFERKKE